MAQHDQTLYIPLQFFFCRHLMCSLPLISLQYHQVEIKVKFKQFHDVVAFPGYKYEDATVDPTDGTVAKPDVLSLVRPRSEMKQNDYQIKKAQLMCNLIYLEEEERKTFAGSTHEYLVDLLQYQGPTMCTGESTTYHAYFNHPTSELLWTIVPTVSIEQSEPFNYSALQSAYNAAGDPLIEARLQFNGYDRFQNMPAAYFREIVPAQYHTSVPTRPVYVYSFALEPEDFRPSGSVNLSRIDNVKLITKHVNFSPTISPAPAENATHPTGSTGNAVAIHPSIETAQQGLYLHLADGKASDVVSGAELRVYARSKNVLRIKSGMAGLAYAN
jgi:hypothetical protein